MFIYIRSVLWIYNNHAYLVSSSNNWKIEVVFFFQYHFSQNIILEMEKVRKEGHEWGKTEILPLSKLWPLNSWFYQNFVPSADNEIACMHGGTDGTGPWPCKYSRDSLIHDCFCELAKTGYIYFFEEFSVKLFLFPIANTVSFMGNCSYML